MLRDENILTSQSKEGRSKLYLLVPARLHVPRSRQLCKSTVAAERVLLPRAQHYTGTPIRRREGEIVWVSLTLCNGGMSGSPAEIVLHQHRHHAVVLPELIYYIAVLLDQEGEDVIKLNVC